MQYLEALSRLGQLHVRLGNRERAMEVYQLLLRREPTHEATYRDMMLLYSELGNRSAAVQTYQQCVDLLANELGVPPMPETVALYQRLVRDP
jgi:DNA-binding SARP family transcriptional activator